MRTINFKTIIYEPSWVYEGGFQFKKHYFGPKPGELLEKRADGKLTEEFQCAQFLDGLQEVEFWLRNLARKATSFRLQTSKDWFYPDFVCQLTDGRSSCRGIQGRAPLHRRGGKACRWRSLGVATTGTACS